MSNDDYMDCHINNKDWATNSPSANTALTIGLLIEYLNTLPKDMPVYCVQEENFSTGDRVIDYFEANLKECFVIEDGTLYIGNVEL